MNLDTITETLWRLPKTDEVFVQETHQRMKRDVKSQTNADALWTLVREPEIRVWMRYDGKFHSTTKPTIVQALAETFEVLHIDLATVKRALETRLAEAKANPPTAAKMKNKDDLPKAQAKWKNMVASMIQTVAMLDELSKLMPE